MRDDFLVCVKDVFSRPDRHANFFSEAAVIVDGPGKTTAANVWACGDVPGYLGTSESANDGIRVGANVLASLVEAR